MRRTVPVVALLALLAVPGVAAADPVPDVCLHRCDCAGQGYFIVVIEGPATTMHCVGGCRPDTCAEITLPSDQ